MSIHERYGLLQEAYDNEVAEHRKTISILAAIKTGQLQLHELQVDPDASTWSIVKDVPAEKKHDPEAL